MLLLLLLLLLLFLLLLKNILGTVGLNKRVYSIRHKYLLVKKPKNGDKTDKTGPVHLGISKHGARLAPTPPLGQGAPPPHGPLKAVARALC